MKNIVSLILIVFGFSAFSQNWSIEKPDYKKIEKAIKKEGSNFFYPSLMARYKAGDTTLTINEKRHLYYGFTFHDNYSPYGHSNYEDSLRSMLNKEELDSLDWFKIVEITDKILEKSPFNMRAMNSQFSASKELGILERQVKCKMQYLTIIDVLMSSGNGLREKTAFYVIDTSHEYALINVLGFQFGGSQSLIKHYDYLTLAENEAGIEGFYFDVSPCLNSLSKVFGK